MLELVICILGSHKLSDTFYKTFSREKDISVFQQPTRGVELFSQFKTY